MATKINCLYPLLATREDLERNTTNNISINQNTIIMRPTIHTQVKQSLRDIYLYITWGKFSNTYFNRSSSWIYNKFNGKDGNGGEGGFTDAEKEQFKQALLDFSEKVRRIAENL